MQHQRRTNLRRVVCRRVATIECHRGAELRDSHSKPHRHAAAEAETDRTDRTRAIRMVLQKPDRGNKILCHLGAVALSLHRPAVIIITRIASKRPQRIRGEGNKSRDCETPGNVFDIRIQATILVNHNNARELVVDGCWPRVVAAHDATAVR